MKKLLIFAVAAMVALGSCNTGRSIKNDIDSISYAHGLNLGYQIIAGADSVLNPNLIAKGIIDVFNKKAAIDRDSAITILNEYYTVKLPAKMLKIEETYLESVKAGNPNAEVTESGLIYEVIMPGDESVKATDSRDEVKVKYTGRFREDLKYDADKQGKEFDSSGDDTVSFALNRVIPGWTEGMKLVGKGGKIRLWVPSALGYGPHGNRGIGPNETLVFDVELVDVTPVEPVVEEE
ncbi:FKBP-type peptidyl-prolyl cis-trans isomerase [Alistipes sp. OttesenSCG-928-B03]|nr:FKBP-type peptidyl-prolyl cis-trans isomerase [Alistipes sp. OttesenSCG-928-B03]